MHPAAAKKSASSVFYLPETVSQDRHVQTVDRDLLSVFVFGLTAGQYS